MAAVKMSARNGPDEAPGQVQAGGRRAPHFGQGVLPGRLQWRLHEQQRAVSQQALVEQGGRGLHNIGTEAAGQADRIIGRMGADTDAFEQARVAKGLQAMPGGSTLGREEI